MIGSKSVSNLGQLKRLRKGGEVDRLMTKKNENHYNNHGSRNST